jgi:hypothetical protein
MEVDYYSRLFPSLFNPPIAVALRVEKANIECKSTASDKSSSGDNFVPSVCWSGESTSEFGQAKK